MVLIHTSVICTGGFNCSFLKILLHEKHQFYRGYRVTTESDGFVLLE